MIKWNEESYNTPNQIQTPAPGPTHNTMLYITRSNAVGVAPGEIREGWSAMQPATVSDDNVIHVGEESGSLGHYHGLQAIGACLLHPFNDELHIHW